MGLALGLLGSATEFSVLAKFSNILRNRAVGRAEDGPVQEQEQGQGRVRASTGS